MVFTFSTPQKAPVAQKLVSEFLDWIDQDQPTHLEVVSYNDRAINFYKKYGFVPTGLSEFGDKIPCIEMMRPADKSGKPN